MNKIAWLSLCLAAGCSSLKPRSSRPVEKVQVNSLGAIQVTSRDHFTTRGSFHVNQRKIREKNAWQWRGRDSVGAPPQSMVSPMFLGGDDLLVSTLGGGLALMDLKSGSARWNIEVPIGVASQPLVVNSAVYVAGMDAIVRKLRLATGEVEWTSRVSAESLGGISTSNGFLFVTTGDDALWALDEKTGRSLWTYKRPSPEGSVYWSLRGDSIPVLSPDGSRIYVGFSDATFVCLEASSGQTLWERRFERSGRFRDADTPPVISKDGNTLYVAIVDGDLVALKATDGTTLWSVPGAGHSPPLLDEAAGVLYFSTNQSQVQKISLRDTSVMWTANLKDAGMGSTPIPLGKGLLAVTTLNGNVVLMNRESGELLWERDFGYGIPAAPATDGRRMVVLSARNRLLLYRVDEKTPITN